MLDGEPHEVVRETALAGGRGPDERDKRFLVGVFARLDTAPLAKLRHLLEARLLVVRVLCPLLCELLPLLIQEFLGRATLREFGAYLGAHEEPHHRLAFSRALGTFDPLDTLAQKGLQLFLALVQLLISFCGCSIFRGRWVVGGKDGNDCVYV